jgi:hypothetical protein
MPRAERRALRAGQDGQNPVQPPRWNPLRRVPGHCPLIRPSKVSIFYAPPARLLAYAILSLTSSSVKARSRCLTPSAQTLIQASVMPITTFTLSSGFSSPEDNGATPEPSFQPILKTASKKRLFASLAGQRPSYIRLLDETTNVPIFVKADNAEEGIERHLRNQ